MADIVERLRSLTDYPGSATREAADEIDRLRDLLRRIHEENKHCAGDSESMAMCIVATEGIALEALTQMEP